MAKQGMCKHTSTQPTAKMKMPTKHRPNFESRFYKYGVKFPMKYFHSLIITGFLIPFLPIQAETAPAQAPQEEIVAENEEEDSLTSLDEELARLDEEFEEFKEELISLENELLQQENSQVAFEGLLKSDEVQQNWSPRMMPKMMWLPLSRTR